MSPTGNVYYYNDTNLKDKVTKISGDTITYDQSGNPLSYRDIMSFTWQNCRQLAFLQTADNNVSYKYDSNGMRTQKTNNSGTTYYYYDSGNNLIGMTKGNNTLLFYYDSDGNVTSFKYGGTMYYYIKNLQGDIVKIINQAGTVYASYVYDAWGNIKSVSGEPILREINPFRYRGYVYDKETGLYYLKSRYYDPETGRFINADIYCDTMSNIFGTNMFTYCNNNPVNQIDPEGTDAIWLQNPNAVNLFFGNAGHTSIMLQDATNCWWYFYLGNTDVIFRPCGSDSFSLESLNTYLRGFDPRPYHNYYVKSYDIGGTYTKSIYFYGCFYDSFFYVFDRLTDIAKYKGKTVEYDKFYENYIPSFAIHIRNNPTYLFVMNNCVNVSLGALLQGTFSDTHYNTSDVFDILVNASLINVPNDVYEYILPTFKDDEKILFGGL